MLLKKGKNKTDFTSDTSISIHSLYIFKQYALLCMSLVNVIYYWIAQKIQKFYTFQVHFTRVIQSCSAWKCTVSEKNMQRHV